MSIKNAKRVFFEYYNGKAHLMTPHILAYCYGEYGNVQRFVELSMGEGMVHSSVYGITVLDRHSDGTIQSVYGASCALHDYVDAVEHIDEIALGGANKRDVLFVGMIGIQIRV